MDHLKLQLHYNHWATGLWISFVYSNAEHDRYLYKLISHIIKGERAWLERITGKEWSRDLWAEEPLEILLSLREANRLMAEDIFNRPVAARIHIERLNGQVYEPKVTDILQHLLFHAENHRGQLASFSAKAGLKYPSTDYMSFIIQSKA